MQITNKQFGKAAIFYAKHMAHVKDLIKQDIPSYPPTTAVDKNNPAIWKANHWKWFLDTYKLV